MSLASSRGKAQPLHVRAAPATAIVSDEALIARIAGGDLDALGICFDRHAAHIRHFVRRLGVSANDVDDLVQLTFIDLSRAAHRFDGRTAARTWLLGIAAIIVRRHRRSLRQLLSRITSARERPQRPPETPDAQYESAEDYQRFLAAVSRLSPKRREVFVMITMEGASGEDTARSLGIPLSTVWTRLFHARRRLQTELGIGDGEGAA